MEAMKGKFSPSEKSTTTITTTTTISGEDSDTRDSNCYFPGCRKDANCSCEICLDSINATLDLMPLSVQKSSLTRLSYASRCKSTVETTPISFDPTVVTTPTSVSRPMSRVSPPKKKKKKQDEKSEVCGEKEPKKNTKIKGISCISVVLRVVLVLGLELGFRWVIKGVFKPELTEDIVRNVAAKSRVAPDMDSKLGFLEYEFKNVFNSTRLSSCRDSESKWKISQGGVMLNSKCILYKSTTEEVSIWGWPLQTAKSLRIGFQSSLIIVLSGRVTEWSDGKFGYWIREANTSLVKSKWSTCVLQLDPETWVLEYNRSSVLDSSSLLSLAIDLLRYVMSQVARNINGEVFWLVSNWENMYSIAPSKRNGMTPT